ncbi:MAG: hypothetical protein Fur0032_08980 [Terrimicrobiaceae bacterium]
MACSFDWEDQLRGLRVAGVDEAGRGPLAGPVVAAAFWFDNRVAPDGLDDSKKLTPRRREVLFEQLTSGKVGRWSVAAVEAPDIDRLNILNATHLAMRKSLENLGNVDHALVDGLPVRGLPVPHTALVGGDAISLSIAAASIIAKVTRDRLMVQLDKDFPQYGFAKHKGYGTAHHLESLRIHGPCPAHRRSFAPVSQLNLLLNDPRTRYCKS